ncbi:hypothetical protein Tco_0195173, partial [Tanacetum coccineum]
AIYPNYVVGIKSKRSTIKQGRRRGAFLQNPIPKCDVKALLLLSFVALEYGQAVLQQIVVQTFHKNLRILFVSAERDKIQGQRVRQANFQNQCSKLVAFRDKEVNMAARDFDDALVCCVEDYGWGCIMDFGLGIAMFEVDEKFGYEVEGVGWGSGGVAEPSPSGAWLCTNNINGNKQY